MGRVCLGCETPPSGRELLGGALSTNVIPRAFKDTKRETAGRECSEDGEEVGGERVKSETQL